MFEVGSQIERFAMGVEYWHEEQVHEGQKVLLAVEKKYTETQSKFQSVGFLQTLTYGHTLVCDGLIQSCDADEYVYHESLVHPALIHHPAPRSVFILGGGEGSTAREVLRHPSVERCVMVDIDQVVIDSCREHLSQNRETFEDHRLEIIVDCARTQLMQAGKFDVIIGDLTDPAFGSPCYFMYTKDFYNDVILSHLNPGGVYVTQSGPAGVLSCSQVFTPINKTCRTVFPSVVAYNAHVPSFSDCWGFNLCLPRGGTSLTEEEFDARVAARDLKLSHMDGATWVGARNLTKSIRASLAAETRLYEAQTVFGANPLNA